MKTHHYSLILFFGLLTLIPIPQSNDLVYAQTSSVDIDAVGIMIGEMRDIFNELMQEYTNNTGSKENQDKIDDLHNELDYYSDKIDAKLGDDDDNQQDYDDDNKDDEDGYGNPNNTPDAINNKVPDSAKSGNPIMFSLPGYGGIEKRDISPDQHESFQVLFPLNNMDMVNMDIQYTSGFMLFWDHDYNNDITNGLEIGWTPHHPQDRTSYTYFSQSMFDFNNNGKLDRYDTLWHSIKVKDMNTGRVYKPLQLGIVAFPMDGWKVIPDDFVTPGSYLDPAQYDTDERYKQALQEEWYPFYIEEQYRHPIRALGWHQYGVIMEDGTTYPSFDVSMGYWGETSKIDSK